MHFKRELIHFFLKNHLVMNANIYHLLQMHYTRYSNHKSSNTRNVIDLVKLVFFHETHLAGNCLLTAGTLKLLAAAFPTLARGLNANALADEAAIASKTIFFMANMLSMIYDM